VQLDPQQSWPPAHWVDAVQLGQAAVAWQAPAQHFIDPPHSESPRQARQPVEPQIWPVGHAAPLQVVALSWTRALQPESPSTNTTNTTREAFMRYLTTMRKDDRSRTSRPDSGTAGS